MAFIFRDPVTTIFRRSSVSPWFEKKKEGMREVGGMGFIQGKQNMHVGCTCMYLHLYFTENRCEDTLIPRKEIDGTTEKQES